RLVVEGASRRVERHPGRDQEEKRRERRDREEREDAVARRLDEARIETGRLRARRGVGGSHGLSFPGGMARVRDHRVSPVRRMTRAGTPNAVAPATRSSSKTEPAPSALHAPRARPGRTVPFKPTNAPSSMRTFPPRFAPGPTVAKR